MRKRNVKENGGNAMRKTISASIVSMAILLTAGLLPLKVSAATENEEIHVVTSEENITSGTLGDNNGIQWTYDADTKTLTVTGEDSGMQGVVDGYGRKSLFYDICSDVETLILHDCAIVGDATYFLASLKGLKSIEFDDFDTSQVTDMTGMFYDCWKLAELDLSEFDTSQVTSMEQMFYNCNFTRFALSNFNTSQVTNMAEMFYGCWKLAELDLSEFDTSQVTNMAGMFYGCWNLAELDLSEFDTSQVTNMASMFSNCSSLEVLDISSFDTSQVTSMEHMFYDCNFTRFALSNFNTSQVTNMASMFSNCSSLENLDISSFDTSQVTHMNRMFYRCKSLKDLDLSGFNTSQVTDMDYMFEECGVEKLDLSNFDTSQTTTMLNMFFYCGKLKELDISGFDMTKVNWGDTTWLHTGHKDIFSGCYQLEILHTPATIGEGRGIDLPNNFVDSQQNMIAKITSEFCNETLTMVSKLVKFQTDTRKLITGYTTQLRLVVDGETQNVAANTDYTWTVDSEDIATVSETGVVTGVSAGTAIITATAKDGSGDTGSYALTVIARIPVAEIVLNKTEVTIGLRESDTLTATILPEDATDKAFVWESSAPEVVSVNERGVLKALALGNATITATAQDGSGTSASCVVTVVEPELVLNKRELSLRVGEADTLTARIRLEDIVDGSVTWVSSNPEVATVDENGLVTAVKDGVATITATVNEGGGIPVSCAVGVHTFTYAEEEGGITITGIRGSCRDNLVIPEVIDGLPVIAIDDCAFVIMGYKNIVIPGSVIAIGSSAFGGGGTTEKVILSKGLRVIGEGAFDCCDNIENIEIPEGVTEIGKCAFDNCDKLTNLMIPKSVTTIGEYAYGYKTVRIETKNPNGEITITSTKELNPNCTITGYLGSEAQRYAEANNIPFIEYVPGVSDSLEEILANHTTEEALEIVKEEYTMEELVEAMRSDDDVIELISQLEEQYLAEHNITVEAEISTAASLYVDDVSVVGAGLNVAEGNVTLDISLPTREEQGEIGNEYKDSIVLNVTLQNNLAELHELTVPVAVTITVPWGIDADKLIIWHYTEAGRESLDFIKNTDGTVTFTTNGFSLYEFAENPFGDVEANVWFHPYVMFAYKHNLMGGKGEMPDGTLKFDPANTITRAEFVQMLYAKESYPAVEYVDTFTDVPDEKWYTDAILWAAEEEIVGGKRADYFDVNGKITRQEIALILYKYALYKGYNTDEIANADLSGFADVSTVSNWADTGMKWAVQYNVIGGKNVNGEQLLAPSGNAIRAEAATMMKAFMVTYEDVVQ